MRQFDKVSRIAVLAFAMLPGGLLQAEPAQPANGKYPVLKADVEPTSATIGEPIRLSVEIIAPDVSRIAVQEPFRSDDRSSTWTLLGRRDFPDEKLSSGEFRKRIEYTIAAFATGDVELPPYSVTWQSDQGTSTTSVLPARSVRIASVLPPDAEVVAAADIRPPVALPFPKWIPVAAVVAALILLAILARAYWAVVRRRVGQMIRPQKRLDAWALDELAAIERERLVEQKKLREFYTRLTNIVRTYLGGLYHINAMDLTTTELMWRLEDDTSAPEEVRRRIADLLNEADLVKFARHIPEAPACRRALEAGREIVLSTRHLLEPAPTEAGSTPRPPAPPPPPPSQPPPRAKEAVQ